MQNNEEYVTSITDKFGTIRYLNEFGQLHRKGQPALIAKDGLIEYYQHGLLDNENGPARIQANGTEVYYRNGRYHNDNGPAIVHKIDGKVFCHEYYKNGLRNNDNGPALEWDNGSYQYYKNGLLHNDKGPALYSKESNKEEYWLEGKPVTKFMFNIKTMKLGLLEKTEGKKPRMK